MTPTTMAQPTPKTVHFVISGVTQMAPIIGDAAMSRANRNSPGAFKAAGRMPPQHSDEVPSWTNADEVTSRPVRAPVWRSRFG